MRCLLVDDEPGIREGLAMLLRRRGYEVQTAADCAGAAARLADEAFDVVVTDWRLPDGTARSFAGGCDSPVLAMSGHPEEVEQGGAIREVLQKPVRPDRLLERIAAVLAEARAGAADAADEPDEPALCRDVQRVVDDLLAQLPAGLAVGCHDDGAFVVLRAALPDGYVPTVRHRGGDLRIVSGDTGRELELRLCRDGRPEPGTAVVAITGTWPAQGPLALDCAGVDVSEQTFRSWLDRAARHRERAGELCLVNVPDDLEPVIEVWETTHDMPMRERVGPRLSVELAELWS